MDYTYTIAITIATLVGLFVLFRLIWEDTPIKLIQSMEGVPDQHKAYAIESINRARTLTRKGTFFDLTAPIVVPFILLFTRWNAEKLRFWDDYYGNNISINGDRFPYRVNPDTNTEEQLPIPIEDTPEARALAYWVDGKHHPRSFYARWIWMGFRNRASRYSMLNGVDLTAVDGDREYWGDPKTGRDHEGTVLYRCGQHYQIYHVRRLGSQLCVRVNCGFKVWQRMHNREHIAAPVNIYISLISWTGSK